MKNRKLVFYLITMALLVAFTAGCAKPSPAPMMAHGKRIAVVSFDTATWRLDSRGFEDILSSELWKHGKFQLVERMQIDRVIKEQNLALSGRLEDAAALQVGRLLGVDYIVMGRLLSAGIETRSGTTTTPGSKSSPPRTSYWTERTAKVSTGIRMVEVATGIVVFSDTANGLSSNTTTGGSWHSDDSSLYLKAATQAIRKLTHDISGVERIWTDKFP